MVIEVKNIANLVFGFCLLLSMYVLGSEVVTPRETYNTYVASLSTMNNDELKGFYDKYFVEIKDLLREDKKPESKAAEIANLQKQFVVSQQPFFKIDFFKAIIEEMKNRGIAPGNLSEAYQLIAKGLGKQKAILIMKNRLRK